MDLLVSFVHEVRSGFDRRSSGKRRVRIGFQCAGKLVESAQLGVVQSTELLLLQAVGDDPTHKLFPHFEWWRAFEQLLPEGG